MTAIAPEPVAKHMQLYPALDAATEAALRASIQRFGVLVPVTKDQHGRILDGHHRVRIATELGVDYGIRNRTVANEVEAREIARTLNEDRRHISIFERREVVEALKVDGHSNVAIGKALGVDESTVRRDLTTDQLRRAPKLPERTVGLDGKSRPARRRRREPKLYFGKGDKWAAASKPLASYLKGWETRNFEFSHVHPTEAAKRLRLIDQLIELLTAARGDLEPRSHKAGNLRV